MNNSHDNNRHRLNKPPLNDKTLSGNAINSLAFIICSGVACSVNDCSDVVCWDKTAKELYDIRLMIQRYSSREKELKEKLIQLSNNESMYNDNYEFKKSFSAGIIDYIRIINDYEIDVEKYRKSENARWKITKL